MHLAGAWDILFSPNISRLLTHSVLFISAILLIQLDAISCGELFFSFVCQYLIYDGHSQQIRLICEGPSLFGWGAYCPSRSCGTTSANMKRIMHLIDPTGPLSLNNMTVHAANSCRIKTRKKQAKNCVQRPRENCYIICRASLFSPCLRACRALF